MTEGTLTRLLHSRYIQVLTLALVVQTVLFYTAAHGEKIPLAKPLDDIGCLGGVGGRIGQIKFVKFDGVIGFMLAPGNFAEPVVNPV